ncbi:MAG: CBS domain-containing protein, partial [Deltaproteobacteria bacterium]|nr:CBS domain-containing protein [Deltaproteobacteria bacterium]
IMTKPLITVPSEMDIRYVARLLYRTGVRRAPVEAQGELMGMISLSDLVLRKGVL